MEKSNTEKMTDQEITTLFLDCCKTGDDFFEKIEISSLDQLCRLEVLLSKNEQETEA